MANGQDVLRSTDATSSWAGWLPYRGLRELVQLDRDAETLLLAGNLCSGRSAVDRCRGVALLRSWASAWGAGGKLLIANRAGEGYDERQSTTSSSAEHIRQLSKYAFSVVGSLSIDSDRFVRRDAVEALRSFAGLVGEETVCGTLRKTGESAVDAHRQSRFGDMQTVEVGDSLQLMRPGAAGAMVYGLEDEFWDVRVRALESLRELVRESSCDANSELAELAVSSLAHLFNDEIEAVRVAALDALACMPAGCVRMTEDELTAGLSLLSETSHTVRSALYRFLSIVVFSNLRELRRTVLALATAITQHSELDEEDILHCLTRMAQSEGAPKMLEQDLLGLLGLDTPFVVPEPPLQSLFHQAIHVTLFAAAVKNPRILGQLPQYVLDRFSYDTMKVRDVFAGARIEREVGSRRLRFVGEAMHVGSMPVFEERALLLDSAFSLLNAYARGLARTRSTERRLEVLEEDLAVHERVQSSVAGVAEFGRVCIRAVAAFVRIQRLAVDSSAQVEAPPVGVQEGLARELLGLSLRLEGGFIGVPPEFRGFAFECAILARLALLWSRLDVLARECAKDGRLKGRFLVSQLFADDSAAFVGQVGIEEISSAADRANSPDTCTIAGSADRLRDFSSSMEEIESLALSLIQAELDVVRQASTIDVGGSIALWHPKFAEEFLEAVAEDVRSSGLWSPCVARLRELLVTYRFQASLSVTEVSQKIRSITARILRPKHNSEAPAVFQLPLPVDFEVVARIANLPQLEQTSVLIAAVLPDGQKLFFVPAARDFEVDDKGLRKGATLGDNLLLRTTPRLNLRPWSGPSHIALRIVRRCSVRFARRGEFSFLPLSGEVSYHVHPKPLLRAK